MSDKLQFDGVAPFSKRRAAVLVGGYKDSCYRYWVFIDKMEKYTDLDSRIGSFKEGLAFVQMYDFNRLIIDRFDKKIVDFKLGRCIQ